jgi:hypothetical protein
MASPADATGVEYKPKAILVGMLMAVNDVVVTETNRIHVLYGVAITTAPLR